jgi:4-diphosphocytidyl-2-C-methyl-D-erythritol kinase
MPSLHRPVITRRAHAKVNLALAVGPPRDEGGFHPIASWMACIDLADDLELTRLEEDYLSRYAIIWHEDARRKTPIDWSVTKDLAVRAHLLMEQEAQRALPVQLKLEKRIPVGGGLGGGSADAAAMLLATRELFELDIADERLAELASKLGSDVPYFLGDGPAIVEGLGERIERTEPVGGALVLVIPDFGCPTGEVYRAFDAAHPGPLREAEVRTMATAGALDASRLFNDLCDAAIGVRPDLDGLMDQVEACSDDLPVHLTGSGSTLFLVCPQGRRHARKLAQRIEQQVDAVAAIPVNLV